MKFFRKNFDQKISQSNAEEYIDHIMGCLAKGPDLVAIWEKEHREEGEHLENERY